MAKKTVPPKAPISAAPVAIATPIDAGKSHKGIASPAQPPTSASSDADPNSIAVQRYMQLELLANRGDVTSLPENDWLKKNAAELGDDFDPADEIDAAHAKFRQTNQADRAITAEYETREHSGFVFNPRISSHSGRDKFAPTAIIDDGFKPPVMKLDKQAARTALAADIRTVSEMYARDAGMSPQDFAKVMGGIATIESRFGVLRSVSGTVHASSAGGAFHYLNGTIAGEVRQGLSDLRISSRVSDLGVSVTDGVSKSEAWTLKEDNILAGSILARRIVETVRKNPELKDDIAALTTRVYQAHNLGDAGARALARGGRQALEATDSRADDNNPMFFRGASNDAEVQARYTKFVAAAIQSSNPLVTSAFSTPKPTMVAAIPLPERAPA